MSLNNISLFWKDITELVSKLKANSDVIAVDVFRIQSSSSQSTILPNAMVVLLKPCEKRKGTRNLKFEARIEGVLKDLGTTVCNYREIADNTWVVTLASAASSAKGQLLITFLEEA